jgi:hypothetical protein
MLNLSFNENGLDTGKLSISAKNNVFFSRLRARPSIVSIVPFLSKDRQEVEQFIMDIYKNSYDADIKVHYPILMSVRDKDGKILAATGFRPAQDETLFLEQYLNAPVEEILETPRSQIVEIGNLASKGGGASLYLFAALSAYLNHNSYSKAVVTSTDFLEKRFRLMGLFPIRHAKANPELLLCEGENWGNYYDTEPHVISGSVAQGYKRLQKQLGIEYTDCRPKLFPRLHYSLAEQV